MCLLKCDAIPAQLFTWLHPAKQYPYCFGLRQQKNIFYLPKKCISVCIFVHIFTALPHRQTALFNWGTACFLQSHQAPLTKIFLPHITRELLVCIFFWEVQHSSFKWRTGTLPPPLKIRFEFHENHFRCKCSEKDSPVKHSLMTCKLTPTWWVCLNEPNVFVTEFITYALKKDALIPVMFSYELFCQPFVFYSILNTNSIQCWLFVCGSVVGVCVKLTVSDGPAVHSFNLILCLHGN